MKLFAALVLLALTEGASAADIVVIGKLLKNEPMSYIADDCPADSICLKSWWISTIRVNRTIQGKLPSHRLVVAGLQHSDLKRGYKKAVRLFVLREIEDPKERIRLRASYYLIEMARSERMFCLSKDPSEFGLNVGETLSSSDEARNRQYCFELPE